MGNPSSLNPWFCDLSSLVGRPDSLVNCWWLNIVDIHQLSIPLSWTNQHSQPFLVNNHCWPLLAVLNRQMVNNIVNHHWLLTIHAKKRHVSPSHVPLIRSCNMRTTFRNCILSRRPESFTWDWGADAGWCWPKLGLESPSNKMTNPLMKKAVRIT